MVLEALRNLQADDAADEAAAQVRAEEAARVAREAEAAGTSHLQVVTPDWAPPSVPVEPAPQAPVAEDVESNLLQVPVESALVAPQFVAHAAVMVNTNALLDAGDDDIDAVDALDPDLFPIFEEEAAELLPQLGGAVRQWTARPGNTSARAESLRALHTLKGSARLAGALRLGEMAHRMESEIEQLGHDDLQSVQIEPLLTRFDALQANFDGLRRTAMEPCAACGARSRLRSNPSVETNAAVGIGADGPANGHRPAGEHSAGAAASGHQPGGARAFATARPAGQPGRRGHDHALAAGGRTGPVARLIERPDRQSGPAALTTARHRTAGRDPDAVAPGAGQGFAGRV